MDNYIIAGLVYTTIMGLAGAFMAYMERRAKYRQDRKRYEHTKR